MGFVYLILRTILTFSVLLVLARLLGNKQLGHLTFFNYITGITVGSIAADIVSHAEGPIQDEFAGLILWCALTAIVGYAGLKSGNLRTWLDGQPMIVIKKGKLMKSALRSARLNLDDLSMLLREQQAFSVAEVEYAVLETNGQLSVLKKPLKAQATREELKIPAPQNSYFPSEIIVDGRIVMKNLREYNLNIPWLMETLRRQNIQSPKDVLYAELQADGSLYTQKQ